MAHGRGRALVAAALAALAPVVLFAAGPALAMPVKESLTPAEVTTGSLTFSGNGFISGGIIQDYSVAAGYTFTMTGAGDQVEITVTGNGHSWQLDMGAADSAELAVGAYINATRWPFAQPGRPSFTLFGDHIGCDQERDEFTIHQLTKDAGGSFQSLRATFVQHCENGLAFDRGQVAINVDPVAPPAEPGSLRLAGDVGPLLYSTSNQDSVLAQSERGGNSIAVSTHRPSSSGPGEAWNLEVAAPAGQQLTAGTTYQSTVPQPGSAQPALSLISSAGLFCSAQDGVFRVNRLHVAPDLSIDRLDLVFLRTCDGRTTTTGRVLIAFSLPPGLSSGLAVSTGTVRIAKLTTIVTVGGNISCSDLARYTLAVTIRQPPSQAMVNRSFSRTVVCSSTPMPWSATVSDNLLSGIGPGLATVTVVATATDPTLFRGTPGSPSAGATMNLGLILPPRRPVHRGQLT